MAHPKIKFTVAALLAVVGFSIPSGGSAEVGSEASDRLLTELGRAGDASEAARIERELRIEWSKSGSAAMDLLLKRGRDALDVNETEVAIDHLTALTDHAPDFAEGWHALALAYYSDDRFGPAVYALERTLALNPDHYGALRGLGAVFDELGDSRRAYDAYRRASDLRPFDDDLAQALDRLDREARGTSL